jgi:hypothetical protein
LISSVEYTDGLVDIVEPVVVDEDEDLLTKFARSISAVVAFAIVFFSKAHRSIKINPLLF